MNTIEAIKNRLIQGYTLSIYGTSELLYEQMEDDISSLLILFDAQKRAIDNLEQELFNLDDDYCNKHKWGDCECTNECKRGLKME